MEIKYTILNIDISGLDNESSNVFTIDGIGDTSYENYSDQPGHIRMVGGATILNLNDTVSLTDISYHNDIYTDRSLNVYGGTYIYDIVIHLSVFLVKMLVLI